MLWETKGKLFLEKISWWYTSGISCNLAIFVEHIPLEHIKSRLNIESIDQEALVCTVQAQGKAPWISKYLSGHTSPEFNFCPKRYKPQEWPQSQSLVSVSWIRFSLTTQRCSWHAAGWNGLRILRPSLFYTHGNVTVESPSWGGTTVTSPHPQFTEQQYNQN